MRDNKKESVWEGERDVKERERRIDKQSNKKRESKRGRQWIENEIWSNNIKIKKENRQRERMIMEGT